MCVWEAGVWWGRQTVVQLSVWKNVHRAKIPARATLLFFGVSIWQGSKEEGYSWYIYEV